MTDDALQAVVQAQGTTRWDRFLYWANRFLHDDPRFESGERTYKLVIGERLVAARAALVAGDAAWVERLHEAVHRKPNNLTSWRAIQPIEAWFHADREMAELAFRSLWNEDLSVPDRFNEFERVVRAADLKAPISEVSFFHMAMGPTDFPMYRSTPVDRAMDLTGYPLPREVGIPAGDIGRRYAHFLFFLNNQVIERGAQRGMVFRDALDAQSATWCVTRWDAPAHWTDEEKTVFAAYQNRT